MVGGKKKTFVLFVLMCLLLAGLLVYIVMSGRHKDVSGGMGADALQEIPSGFAREVPDKKSESYQERVNITTEDYFDMLPCSGEDDMSLLSEAEKPEKIAGAEGNGSAADRVFGPGTHGLGHLPDVDTDKSPSRAASPIQQMTQDERLEYDRRRIEMVKEVMSGGNSSGELGERMGHDRECPEEVSGDAVADMSGKSGATDMDDGIVSSLDSPSGSSAGNANPGTCRPVRCMFTRSEKIHDRERIKIRLLEEYKTDGIVIPANTHLTAVCSIGDRLELSVLGVQLNGVIVPLSLEAYDMDGMPGIYCPETVTSRSAERVSGEAVSAARTVIGGFVGNLANTIVRTGASLAQSATGKTVVGVVSGYEFFLFKKDKR